MQEFFCISPTSMWHNQQACVMLFKRTQSLCVDISFLATMHLAFISVPHMADRFLLMSHIPHSCLVKCFCTFLNNFMSFESMGF